MTIRDLRGSGRGGLSPELVARINAQPLPVRLMALRDFSDSRVQGGNAGYPILVSSYAVAVDLVRRGLAALVSGESSPGMTPAPVKETKVEAPVEFKSEPANEEADVNVAPVVRKRGRPKK